MSLLIGILFGLVVDALWWAGAPQDEDFKEKKLTPITWLEHYHWSIVIWLMAIVLPQVYTDLPLIAITSLQGWSIALMISEWAEPFATTKIGKRISGENEKHPFSIGSDHLVASSIIGLILFIILVAFQLNIITFQQVMPMIEQLISSV